MQQCSVFPSTLCKQIYEKYLNSARKNDEFVKPLMLAMTVSVLINRCSLASERTNYTDKSLSSINIRQFLYESLVLISFVVGLSTKNSRIQFLLILSSNLTLAAVSVFYYHHHEQIIHEARFIPMMLISLLGYGFVLVLDHVIKLGFIQFISVRQGKERSQQDKGPKANLIIRRKIFHIAPLLIVPLLAYLNVSLLKVMLCGSFYILFNLQLVRYNQSQVSTERQTKLGHLDIYRSYFKRWFGNLFVWMQQFNQTRQPNFWFTHLFLYLTITMSYEFYANDPVKKNIGLMLMLADGVAAFVGSSYGKVKIYQSKTLLGLSSYFVTMLLGQILLCSVLSQQAQFGFLVVISVFTALCELFSGDLDNILCIWVYILIDLIYHF